MTPIDRRKADRRRKQPSAVSKERRAGERRDHTPRRRSPRVPVSIWVEESDGTNTYLRRTGDLSEDGVFFDVALPSPVGSKVTLRFTLPGETEEVVAVGEVANVGTAAGHLGMGIAFTRIEGDGKKRIRKFILSS